MNWNKIRAMKWNPDQLPEEALDFLTERHLATLSIPRDTRAPHTTPVGFSWNPKDGLARVITFADANKVRLLSEPRQVTLCQVDGGRWLSLSGTAEITADPEKCRRGEELYGVRYSPPKNRGADRRVIEIKVKQIMGRV